MIIKTCDGDGRGIGGATANCPGSLPAFKTARHADGSTVRALYSESPIDMLWPMMPRPLPGMPMTKQAIIKGPIRKSPGLPRARNSPVGIVHIGQE